MYLAPYRDRYEVHVLGREGSLERKITSEVKAPKRTAERMRTYREGCDAFTHKTPGASSILVADADPAIQELRVDGEGYLWVLSAAGTRVLNDQFVQEYDVFDSTGVLKRRVEIACDGDGEKDALLFVGDKRVVRAVGARAAVAWSLGWVVMPAANEENGYGEVVCYEVVH